MSRSYHRWTDGRSPFIAAVVLLLLLSLLCFTGPMQWVSNGFMPIPRPLGSHARPAAPSNRPSPPADSPICPGGGQDVVVIMKTGATESYKVPALLETIYRCVPSLLIFSDLEEFKYSHQFHDALDEIPEEVIDAHEELKFYIQQKENHRLGRPLDSFRAGWDGVTEDSPGWKLDKWKFLPMVQKTLRMKPNAKWFVFVEADTYLSWSNLVQWLPMLDSSKSLYLGAPNWVAGRIYAHGGSGFVMTANTMRKLSDRVESQPAHFVDVVASAAFGDLALADALREVDVDISRTWPMIQGETPASLDYTSNHWCYPMITEHHMSAQDIDVLWDFEQRYLRDSQSDDPMLHADIFRAIIEPKFAPHIEDWDNFSLDREVTPASDLTALEAAALTSEQGCRDLCVEDRRCLQYNWEKDSCKLGRVIRFGRTKTGPMAGFLMDRIERAVASLGVCSKPKWITNVKPG